MPQSKKQQGSCREFRKLKADSPLVSHQKDSLSLPLPRWLHLRRLPLQRVIQLLRISPVLGQVHCSHSINGSTWPRTWRWVSLPLGLGLAVLARKPSQHHHLTSRAMWQLYIEERIRKAYRGKRRTKEGRYDENDDKKTIRSAPDGSDIHISTSRWKHVYIKYQLRQESLQCCRYSTIKELHRKVVWRKWWKKE